MKHATDLQVDDAKVISVVNERFDYVSQHLLTPEFNYQYCGFCFLHFGRRGTTVSLWHWAEWDATWEIFNHSWYCYNHQFAGLELLSMKEPVFCHYDYRIVFQECEKMRNAIERNGSPSEIAREYLEGACDT